MNFGEFWDDGNNVSGDGWAANWQTEPGFACIIGGGTPASTWTPVWGDGVLVGTEGCDDGNLIDNDGWNAICGTELGFLCTNGAGNPSTTWTEIWGDGLVIGNEECDDGNTSNGDGWDSTWKLESTINDSETVKVWIRKFQRIKK